MQIHDKISLLRRQKGLTQEQLAEVLEVSRQAVYKWETGASVPELDKIKRLAQYFRVSFDTLLDDTMEIDTDVYEVPESITPARKESAPKEYYRPVFLSSYKMLRNYIDITHGYADGNRGRNPNASNIYNAFEREAQAYFVNKGLENLRLIPVAPLYFFINRESATIGIVFDGMHQFVCPFENLVDTTILQESNGFTVTISYKDLMGNIRHYELAFDYDFYYPLLNEEIRHMDALQKRRAEVKEAIRERLNTMKEKLLICKQEGARYLHGEVEAPPFDPVAYHHSHAAIYAARAEREREKKRMEQQEEANRRKRQEAERLAAIKAMEMDKARKRALIKKYLLIGLAALAAVALILTLVLTIRDCSAKSSLKQQAQPVVDMIDALDGVTITLDHADELDAIRDAYKALPQEAKELVTNWGDYIALSANYPNARLTVDDLVGTWESERYIIYIENISGKKAVIVGIYNKETQTSFDADFRGIYYSATMHYLQNERTMAGTLYDADEERKWGFSFRLSYDSEGRLVLTNNDPGTSFYREIFYKK